jgi:hypothetical protein
MFKRTVSFQGMPVKEDPDESAMRRDNSPTLTAGREPGLDDPVLLGRQLHDVGDDHELRVGQGL